MTWDAKCGSCVDLSGDGKKLFPAGDFRSPSADCYHAVMTPQSRGVKAPLCQSRPGVLDLAPALRERLNSHSIRHAKKEAFSALTPGGSGVLAVVCLSGGGGGDCMAVAGVGPDDGLAERAAGQVVTKVAAVMEMHFE